MAEQPALHLDGVTRRFRQGNSVLEILRSVNLSVWPGESVALIAPIALTAALAPVTLWIYLRRG